MKVFIDRFFFKRIFIKSFFLHYIFVHGRVNLINFFILNRSKELATFGIISFFLKDELRTDIIRSNLIAKFPVSGLREWKLLLIFIISFNLILLIIELWWHGCNWKLVVWKFSATIRSEICVNIQIVTSKCYWFNILIMLW